MPFTPELPAGGVEAVTTTPPWRRDRDGGATARPPWRRDSTGVAADVPPPPKEPEPLQAEPVEPEEEEPEEAEAEAELAPAAEYAEDDEAEEAEEEKEKDGAPEDEDDEEEADAEEEEHASTEAGEDEDALKEAGMLDEDDDQEDQDAALDAQMESAQEALEAQRAEEAEEAQSQEESDGDQEASESEDKEIDEHVEETRKRRLSPNSRANLRALRQRLQQIDTALLGTETRFFDSLKLRVDDESSLGSESDSGSSSAQSSDEGEGDQVNEHFSGEEAKREEARRAVLALRRPRAAPAPAKASTISQAASANAESEDAETREAEEEPEQDTGAQEGVLQAEAVLPLDEDDDSDIDDEDIGAFFKNHLKVVVAPSSPKASNEPATSSKAPPKVPAAPPLPKLPAVPEGKQAARAAAPRPGQDGQARPEDKEEKRESQAPQVPGKREELFLLEDQPLKRERRVEKAAVAKVPEKLVRPPSAPEQSVAEKPLVQEKPGTEKGAVAEKPLLPEKSQVLPKPLTPPAPPPPPLLAKAKPEKPTGQAPRAPPAHPKPSEEPSDSEQPPLPRYRIAPVPPPLDARPKARAEPVPEVPLATKAKAKPKPKGWGAPPPLLAKGERRAVEGATPKAPPLQPPKPVSFFTLWLCALKFLVGWDDQKKRTEEDVHRAFTEHALAEEIHQDEVVQKLAKTLVPLLMGIRNVDETIVEQLKSMDSGFRAMRTIQVCILRILTFELDRERRERERKVKEKCVGADPGDENGTTFLMSDVQALVKVIQHFKFDRNFSEGVHKLMIAIKRGVKKKKTPDGKAAETDPGGRAKEAPTPKRKSEDAHAEGNGTLKERRTGEDRPPVPRHRPAATKAAPPPPPRGKSPRK